jgi:hypothetical protein
MCTRSSLTRVARAPKFMEPLAGETACLCARGGHNQAIVFCSVI